MVDYLVNGAETGCPAPAIQMAEGGAVVGRGVQKMRLDT